MKLVHLSAAGPRAPLNEELKGLEAYDLFAELQKVLHNPTPKVLVEVRAEVMNEAIAICKRVDNGQDFEPIYHWISSIAYQLNNAAPHVRNFSEEQKKSSTVGYWPHSARAVKTSSALVAIDDDVTWTRNFFMGLKSLAWNLNNVVEDLQSGVFDQAQEAFARATLKQLGILS